MGYLLSICITSYNRVYELKRCIASIKVPDKYIKHIQIVVSEDNSPKQLEISNLISKIKESSIIDIKFNSNKSNLGYDRNLKKLISLADGDYIVFLSDDDALDNDTIEKLMPDLESKEYKLLYFPFRNVESNTVRRKYNKTFTIMPGEESAITYLYDSILFSGLCFYRKAIKEISADRFLNINYFQVYLFLFVIYRFGGKYLDKPTVLCIGDGENAFGISESSEKNMYLADRKSVFSNLEFHKGLFKAIRYFDSDYGTNIFDGFSKEYSLRSYTGMAKARACGIKVYYDYLKAMNRLDIKFSVVVIVYSFILLILGQGISDIIMTIPKRLLIRIRNNV